MASYSSSKGSNKVQNSSSEGSSSPIEKNLKSSNSPKVCPENQSRPQNGKLSTSPRPDIIMPTPQIMGPSGKKRLSPTCTPNHSNNNSMCTLNVDIDLANAKMNSVSPGRHCLSDSRLTVKPSKNIPASNHRKRKIDIDGAEISSDLTVPMTSPKRKKLSPPDICNLNNMQSNKDLLTVDWNQNEKNVADGSFGKRRSSWSETSPDCYKHSHNIGHRKVSPRVSPKMSNSSELPAPVTWKTLPNCSPKVQSNHKDIHNVDKHVNSVPPSSNTNMQQNGHLQSSATSNGEQKRPSFSHSISNDSVFEDNVVEPSEIDEERFEKVDSEVAFNRTPGIKNNAAGDMGKPKQATGRTSPRGGGKPKEVVRKSTLGSGDSGVDSKRKRKGSISESVGSESVISSCTEDSFTDEGSIAGRDGLSSGLSSPEDGKPRKRRFKFADTLPPRAPRARRVASLTAETKNHLLYERDEFIEKLPAKVSAPKKPKTTSPIENCPQVDDSLRGTPRMTAIKPAQDSCKDINDSKGKINTGDCMNMTNEQEKPKKSKKPTVKARLKEVTSPTSSAPQLATNTTSAQMCTRCGKPMKPQGNTAIGEPLPGNSIHMKPDTSANGKSINPSSTTPSPSIKEQPMVPHSAATQMHLSCSCPQAHRSISEPAAENSLMKALAPLLGQPRRASVDTAECEKLNELKGAILLRLSRHSIEAPTAIANQLSLPLAQLGILQSGNLHAANGTPNNGTIATVPPSNGTGTTVTTEFITSKSKVVRKVVKRPGLKPFHRRKSTNGWRGEGNPVQKPVIINSESVQEVRYCYEAIRRKDDVIKNRDCVLLRADLRKRDLPFVAKVAALYEDPDTGDLMMSLLWYYRPEHTEAGRLKSHLENEIFACRHWDINSVACIEDKCYVVTLAEYNRFYSKLKRTLEGIRPGRHYVPEPLDNYPRKEAVPPQGFDPDAVFLCRQVYDFRQHRVLKNPY